VELDPRDYEVRVAQAQADLATANAQLEQAKSQIAVDEAKAEQQQAATVAAEAESERAAADLKRYETVASEAVSQSQIDLARAQARTTAANVLVTSNQTKAATAQVTLSRVSVDAAKARVEQAQSSLDLAGLNLSYTKVTALTNGRVTMRTVEAGVNVQIGQALMALVPDEAWVVANFKETQLAHMRTNQPATIRLDAYPGRSWKGHVDSIQSGTGAAFSLLPAENAVGNYVKVVQRVPVKIVLDEPFDPQLDMAPGMSVEPRVKVK
jgi:membrane fusion protein (multidrug efflux system)